ncbi:MAG: hypothetical protein HC859_15375, partial [Bacteroidia bacterium]|nr:hypothetical protein [Bacteroidia bacterium]
MELAEKIRTLVREVKDYPKEGILFKDITPVLADPDVVRAIIAAEARQLRPLGVDAVAAVEAPRLYPRLHTGLRT